MVNLFWLAKPQIKQSKNPIGIVSMNYSGSDRWNYDCCAQYHIDAHIVKIPLETTQLLYTLHHLHPKSEDWRVHAPETKSGNRGYRIVHQNHPIRKWVSKSLLHYRHAVDYGLALCKEYTFRYDRIHACEQHLRWLASNEPNLKSSTEFLNPPLCMPEEYRIDVAEHPRKKKAIIVLQDSEFSSEVYESYRRYYIGEKLKIRMSTWKKRENPEWLIKESPNSQKKKILQSQTMKEKPLSSIKRKLDPNNNDELYSML